MCCILCVPSGDRVHVHAGKSWEWSGGEANVHNLIVAGGCAHIPVPIFTVQADNVLCCSFH